MLKRTRKFGQRFKSQRLPKFYRARVGCNNEIELHRLKPAALGVQ